MISHRLYLRSSSFHSSNHVCIKRMENVRIDEKIGKPERFCGTPWEFVSCIQCIIKWVRLFQLHFTMPRKGGIDVCQEELFLVFFPSSYSVGVFSEKMNWRWMAPWLPSPFRRELLVLLLYRLEANLVVPFFSFCDVGSCVQWQYSEQSSAALSIV